MTTVATVDRNETSVVTALQNARELLAWAVEASGPAAVANIKAQIVMAETYAKELGLSKEIRDDATEMVRRAEYALGKAIRKGQAEGTVRNLGWGGPTADYERGGQVVHVDRVRDETAISPKEFLGSGQVTHEVYAMADGASAEEFEDALTEARSEGNLSRANVVRKVKAKVPNQTRTDRAEIIQQMAAEGHHRDQVARHLGITREAVNNIARDYSIDFPADSVGRVRRADSARIVRETVNTLEGLLMALPLVDVDDLDPAEAGEWTASLDQSLRALNRFNKKIKEAVR